MKNLLKPYDVRLFGLKMATVVLMFVLLSSARRGISQEVYSSSSSYASYEIDANGNLYTWGEDEYLHPVTTAMMAQDLTPVKVAFPPGVTRWATIAAGHVFTLAIGNDGNVYAWGDNEFGQLGDGNTIDSDTLVKVELPSGVTAATSSATVWTFIAARRWHARVRAVRASWLTRISYHVGMPWMFEGIRFLAETGTPIRKMARTSRALALADPVPLTVAILQVSSLTPAAR